jgi:multidrug resistance efflux pump
MSTALAKESIEYNYIRAPFDGIILEKHFEEGMNIGAGTPLLKISTRDSIMIKTYIDNTLYTYKV